jgi:hypothetical protein
MAKTWDIRNGQVMVIEDANTASLVVVGKSLKDRADKITVLEEVINKLRVSDS